MDCNDVGIMEAELEMDETWLWEEPTVVLGDGRFDDKELLKARTEEIKELGEFEAYEWYTEGDARKVEGGIWFDSKWVDERKSSGELRSRWVGREFARGNSAGDYFSPTPDHAEIEVLHLFALNHSHEIRYLDLRRAFLHAPELEWVFTNHLKGGSDQDGFGECAASSTDAETEAKASQSGLVVSSSPWVLAGRSCIPVRLCLTAVLEVLRASLPTWMTSPCSLTPRSWTRSRRS